VLACTMGQSGSLGSDSTKDFCSLMRGARREEGRSCAGTPDGPVDHRNMSPLCLPVTTNDTRHELNCCVKVVLQHCSMQLERQGM
jgi:hypothetical protein